MKEQSQNQSRKPRRPLTESQRVNLELLLLKLELKRLNAS